MENASNALLIAAGVLIGIMILSIAVFLFVNFSSISRDAQSTITANQLQEFNAKFSIYENRKDLTIYDVITVANLAKQNNYEYSASNVFDTEYKVTVMFDEDKDNNFENSNGDKVCENNFQTGTVDNYQLLIGKYNEVYKQGDSLSSGKEIGDLKYNFKIGNISYNSTNGRVQTIKINHN